MSSYISSPAKQSLSSSISLSKMYKLEFVSFICLNFCYKYTFLILLSWRNKYAYPSCYTINYCVCPFSVDFSFPFLPITFSFSFFSLFLIFFFLPPFFLFPFSSLLPLSPFLYPPEFFFPIFWEAEFSLRCCTALSCTEIGMWLHCCVAWKLNSF